MFLQALFHKQHSDDSELAAGRNKTKLSNIVVECRKTGEVVVLTPESIDQPSESQKWEKCKLALVKTVGGYLLEFYSPPNAKKVTDSGRKTGCARVTVNENFCLPFFLASERRFLFSNIRCSGNDRAGNAKSREHICAEGRQQYGICDRSNRFRRYAQLAGNHSLLHAKHADGSSSWS